MNTHLLNKDSGYGGIYRAILLDENRVYIPSIMQKRNFDNIKIFPEALWCAPNKNCTSYISNTPCWITFENGDTKRPIIMGFLGNGIKSRTYSSGNVSSGSTIENNSANSTINNETNSTINNAGSSYTGDISEAQQKVAEFAKTFKGGKYGGSDSSKSGYCQAWVADAIYLALDKKYPRQSKSDAKTAGNAWKVSNDLNNIPIGATVWALYNPHGHAAIYIGNGYISNNRTGNAPEVETLEFYKTWASKKSGFTGLVWGWNGGLDLTNL